MIVLKNKLNKIRFDIYDKPISVKKLENKKEIKYQIGIVDNTTDYVLIIKVRVYSLDLDTNIELFGYLGEVTNLITKTSLDLDRFSLATYIKSIVEDVKKFLNENVPLYQTLEFAEFDTSKYVDEILIYLTSLGWY